MRLIIVPAHSPRLLQQQGSAFGAVHARALVGFGELRFQSADVVVVLIHLAGQRMDVSLRHQKDRAMKKQESGNVRRKKRSVIDIRNVSGD